MYITKNIILLSQGGWIMYQIGHNDKRNQVFYEFGVQI